MPKSLIVWIRKKLWKILPEMGIPDHLTCLLKNLHEFMKQQLELNTEQQNGSKSGKKYVKGYILSPCLFNLYAEYVMINIGLDEVQAGIKISWRNINKSDMQITPPL